MKEISVAHSSRRVFKKALPTSAAQHDPTENKL